MICSFSIFVLSQPGTLDLPTYSRLSYNFRFYQLFALISPADLGYPSTKQAFSMTNEEKCGGRNRPRHGGLFTTTNHPTDLPPMSSRSVPFNRSCLSCQRKCSSRKLLSSDQTNKVMMISSSAAKICISRFPLPRGKGYRITFLLLLLLRAVNGIISLHN